ncbi:MAG: SDR family oxidoreductase [Rhodococcus sp. (in: high G+C Gram-positive bacteria)]|uniref:SDR family NAD(P)-dependent oxidoreductase n=1 Tax=Rhodococcus sp. TaxID=1831 RepID=UPI003BAF9B9F
MGAGLVRSFGVAGASVVSVDIDEPEGSRIAAESGATFMRCDVSEKDSVEEAFDRAASHLGGIDVVVHAAGIAPGAAAEETPIEIWKRTMEVNATGTFLTNQAAFQHLREKGGRIINLASAAGVKGYPGKAAYAASKGAVSRGCGRSPSNGLHSGSR